jgi:hypothetical protein
MAAPKAKPFKPNDGTAEKKPPTAQAEASPDPYPMKSPPAKTRVYMAA